MTSRWRNTWRIMIFKCHLNLSDVHATLSLPVERKRRFVTELCSVSLPPSASCIPLSTSPSRDLSSRCSLVVLFLCASASEMTYTVPGGTLNATYSCTHNGHPPGCLLGTDLTRSILRYANGGRSELRWPCRFIVLSERRDETGKISASLRRRLLRNSFNCVRSRLRSAQSPLVVTSCS